MISMSSWTCIASFMILKVINVIEVSWSLRFILVLSFHPCFNLVLDGFWPTFCMNFLFPRAYYMFFPVHSLWFKICNSTGVKQSCLTTCHEGAWGERKYSSYSFLTSALDGGEWSASRPSRALPRGKDPWYPLNRRLGGPQSQSGRRG
jgi:hypothetical protein